MDFYEYTNYLNNLETLSYKKIDISSSEKDIVGTRISLETSKGTVNIDTILNGQMQNEIIIYKENGLACPIGNLDFFKYKNMVKYLIEMLEERHGRV